MNDLAAPEVERWKHLEVSLLLLLEQVLEKGFVLPASGFTEFVLFELHSPRSPTTLSKDFASLADPIDLFSVLHFARRNWVPVPGPLT